MANDIIGVININLDRKALSSSDFTVKTQPWRSGDIVAIDTVTICCVDGTNKYVNVGILQGDKATYYETVNLTANGYFYPTTVTPHFYSDTRLIVKILSPTAGHQYRINIFGRLLSTE